MSEERIPQDRLTEQEAYRFVNRALDDFRMGRTSNDGIVRDLLALIERVQEAARAEGERQFAVLMTMWRDQYARAEEARAEGTAAVAGPVLALAEMYDGPPHPLPWLARAIRAVIPTDATEALDRLKAQWQAEAWSEGWEAAQQIVELEGKKVWAHTVFPEGYEGNPYRMTETPT